MRWSEFLGKFLISVGFGILLFVGWELKGTDFYTARQQEALAAEFDRLPALTFDDEQDEDVGPPRNFTPGPGSPVFKLRIPAIDVSSIVVEGVGVDELRQGPGHYPSCRDGFDRPLCTDLDSVWPGEEGRVILSGHRTTYGAPFWGVDRLKKGDEIVTETKWGTFTYEVTGKEIVDPDSTDIANPAASTDREIVLTTCHPKFSAAQRLIVYAELLP